MAWLTGPGLPVLILLAVAVPVGVCLIRWPPRERR